MTLTTTSTKNSPVTNDTTGPFVYGFRILAKTDLEVYLVNDTTGAEDLQTVDTDYSVAGVGDATGGSITFVTAPTTALYDSILIRRAKPKTQDTDLSSGVYPPDNIEQRMDILTMALQELEERIQRVIQFKKSSTLSDIELAEIADGFIKFTAAGTGVEAVAINTLLTSSVVVSTFMETVLDDANAQAASETISAGALMLDALPNGWTSNLGLSLSSGVLTVTAADGTALSAANPGYVVVPSTTTGRPTVLKVTAPYTISDTSADTHMDNFGFGITKTADWASDMPFFIGVINVGNTDCDGTDGGSAFFITRRFAHTIAPSSAVNIGDLSAVPVTDSQSSMIIMDTVTVASYVSKRVLNIGALRIKWDTSDNGWNIQVLDAADGIGQEYVDRVMKAAYTFPQGQNGAGGSTHLKANGGTAPAFTTTDYAYSIDRNGMVTVFVSLDADAGTDGAGAVTTQVALPYKNTFSTTQPVGVIRMNSSVTGAQFVEVSVAASGDEFDLTEVAGTPVQNTDFGNGARSIAGSFKYKAF